MASKLNKLKIPSYIINIIQDKLGEIEVQRLKATDNYLEPIIIGGTNGNNHCWLNSAMYMYIAHWNIFKQFHNDAFLKHKLQCDLKAYNRYKQYYDAIYNYLDYLSTIQEWDLPNYIKMIKNIQILGTQIKTNDKLKKIPYELPITNRQGNSQDFVILFRKIIVKECSAGKHYRLEPAIIGSEINKLDYRHFRIPYPNDDNIHFEAISILKPTSLSDISIASHGTPISMTIPISHWTCYVRKRNNKWILFDMLQDGSRGNHDKEYTFGELFEKDIPKTKVYHCYFLMLNTDYIYGKGNLPDINLVCNL